MYTLSFQYYGGDVYFLYTISPEWNVDSQLLAFQGGPLEYYLPALLLPYLWALGIFKQDVLSLSVLLCNCSGLRLSSSFKISLKILLFIENMVYMYLI